MISSSPLILVDGSSYLYRAFHIPNLQKLRTADGRPTGAVRGVVSMLKKLHREYPDSALVVVFDAKGKTFRDDLFAQYKAHRPSMPDELREQLEPLHRCVEALGFPMLIIPGVEADDVIGTLALEAAADGRDVLISTGDKDMAQLVGERISLVNTMYDSYLDTAGVEEKFGVPPHLIIDFLALIGDKSDNIPGVPGIGEKSALPILQALGGLDDVYANLDAIAEMSFRGAKSVADKLRENKDQAYLSYQLATIKTDVELHTPSAALINGEPDIPKLQELYRDLEFRSWLDELAADEVPIAANPIAQSYQVITDKDLYLRWVDRLARADIFAFDTETTGLDYMTAEIVGVSFAIEAGEAAYVPLTHDYPGAPEQLEATWALQQLQPILADPGKTLIGQNIKFDMSILARVGIEIHCQLEDTMLQSYVLDAAAGRHDMDSLAQRHLQRATIRFEDIAGKGAKQITFNQIGLEQAGPYAAEDADVTLQLHNKLRPALAAEMGLERVYTQLEMPLVPVLSRMERHGAKIDCEAMRRQSQEIGVRLIEVEAEVHKLAGQPFNLGSPKQLQHILYEKMNLPVVKKTPTGQPSTAEEVLQELAADFPLPALILEYRGLAKLKSTYTDKLPTMVDRASRLHTSYHQAVAATGRLSSSEPNLQNIPVRTEEGRRIRKAFVAPPGQLLLAADYSQIELRIMAHLSGDKGLLQAFAHGLDVHKATAAEVFGVPLDEVSGDQRRAAKAINFGLMYGMSAFGLGRQLHIGRNQAQEYMDRYFERYPGVAAFMETIRKQARETGYVETLFGRRLYLPDINASNGQLRQAAERAAINAPMQGTAADIIKQAMIQVDAWLTQEAPPVTMIMQVHDELVFEVADSYVDRARDKIRQLMQSAASLDVPLLVDVGVGSNWEEAH